MNISGEAKLICSALVKARGDMNATVIKDGKGNYGMYATLAAIVEASAPSFSKYGLTVVQEVGTNEQGVVISTWLIHESGATIEFEPLPMPLSNRTPQAVGSAITYGRRYALAAVCGLAPDDDDGQAAQDAHKPQNARTASNGTNTHAAPENNDTGAMWEPEVGPELLSDAQLKRLHAIGTEYYGAEWDVQRPKIVEAVSKGVITSSAKLTPQEADKLIKGIEKRLTEKLTQPATA